MYLGEIDMAPRVISIALAVVCAVVALTLARSAGDANSLKNAETAGLRGDYLASMQAAQEVDSQPSLTRAYVVRAYAALLIGDLPNSDRWFAVAVREAPNDWELRRDWSRLLLLLGRIERSKEERRAAKELNPLAKNLNPLLTDVIRRSD